MGKRLHHYLIEASGAHYKRSRQELQALDLSPGQPKVLAFLNENEGCSQKELAEQCRVEPATMTILLRNMSHKGLIKKTAANLACGKRAFIITLTELGREKAEHTAGIMDALEQVCYTGFSEQEKETLCQLLQRVTDNLMGQSQDS